MIPVVCLASGLGAGNDGCGKGPLLIQSRLSFETELRALIEPEAGELNKLDHISLLNQRLAEATYKSLKDNPFTLILGGDHSCGVGTWSGVSEALRETGEDLALLWLDAHMDSHTPDTSESGNIHGMPVASLLGHGSSCLTKIFSEHPKVKPENVFLLGIRSYETPEKVLLERLGVRIYYIEEVLSRGLSTIFSEIVDHLAAKQLKYGISLDIDPAEFLQSYPVLASHPPIAFEFVEFNPDNETNSQSLDWTLKILNTVHSTVTDLAKLRG
jgi:arginase